MKVFTEYQDVMEYHAELGWTCVKCEGGWMCFEYASDAETWEKQR